MKAASLRRTTSGSLVVLAMVWLGVSCTVISKADLARTTDNMQIWEVSDSVGRVFGTYKDYAGASLTGSYSLFSGGRKVSGSLQGNTAELSVFQEGNPFYRVTFLHFVFEASGNTTKVWAWYYNDVWRHRAEEFKILLPAKVVSVPSTSNVR